MDYKNKTAVVTGASAGLGVEYAKELAARGSNLVLVARRKDLLDALGAQITEQHAVRVDTLSLDLSTPGAAKKLVAALKKLSVDTEILINNAGFGTTGRFVDNDADRVTQEINLNVTTLVDLTRALLPAMLKKNSGAIVNIASTAAYQPLPGLAVYAATKAFVLSFTSAVWGETKDTGVRVLTVSPGPTDTDFFEAAGSDPTGPLAPTSQVIEATFKALDAPKSVPAVIAGRRNALLSSVSKLLPTKMVIGVASKMFLKD